MSSEEFDRFMEPIRKRRERNLSAEVLAYRELDHLLKDYIKAERESKKLKPEAREFQLRQIEKKLEAAENVRRPSGG